MSKYIEFLAVIFILLSSGLSQAEQPYPISCNLEFGRSPWRTIDFVFLVNESEGVLASPVFAVVAEWKNSLNGKVKASFADVMEFAKAADDNNKDLVVGTTEFSDSKGQRALIWLEFSKGQRTLKLSIFTDATLDYNKEGRLEVSSYSKSLVSNWSCNKAQPIITLDLLNY